MCVCVVVINGGSVVDSVSTRYLLARLGVNGSRAVDRKKLKKGY